ncbi:MAG: phosphoribosyltransferase family protein [Solirubrobacterales bacterium]
MTQPRHERRTGAVNSIFEPPLPPVGGDVLFADRHDAGRRLAALLGDFRGESPVVVGIPRGGVPVAAEVARALGAPLDLVVVRKVGAPENPEYAIGALAESEVSVIDDATVRALGLGTAELEAVVGQARRELDERLARYQGKRPRLAVAGRTVLLVDDGLATGRTAQAAARSLRERGAARVILAVPVAARESARELRSWVDEVVCVEMPEHLWAIGLLYEDFSPTSDAEVAALLAEDAGAVEREVAIEAAPGLVLTGDLTVPSGAYGRGVVVFAHGSGSSRLSPRNRQVARALNEAGFATLLFDLLTASEEVDRTNVFDIPLLAQRLVAATRWLRSQPETARLALGYFGASTGSAAALLAAAELSAGVCAVVSRGGRPDLAQPWLGDVVAPVLLIVGGADAAVLELNREALHHLRCENELAVVPGATHLFEEPSALDSVARLAIDWFTQHLYAGAPAPEAGRVTHA